MISSAFIKLFGKKPRSPDEEITKFYMDIAASIQCATEEVILKITSNLYDKYKVDNLCLAGGVALNCVANGKIIDQNKFKNIWIQPAAGDSGGALGAALAVLYSKAGIERKIKEEDTMNATLLGPSFSNKKIKEYLNFLEVPFHFYADESLFIETAKYLSEGKVVGWFQGRMEYGPRALGNRSILGDPRILDMQKKNEY